MKRAQFYHKNKGPKSCRLRKTALPLHPLKESDGGIAQLVRAHDS